MNAHEIFASPVVERLGWMLLHSVWQLALIALAVGLVMRLSRLSARVRYGIACLGMLAMVICPVATFFLIDVPEPDEPVAETATFARPDFPPEKSTPDKPLPPIADIEVTAEVMTAGRPVPLSTNTVEVTPEPPTLHARLAGLAPWFVPPWLAGMLLLALWQLGGYYCTRRWITTAKPMEPEFLTDKLARLAERLGVKQTVRLLQSTRVATPLVLGWIRPAILLPVELITNLPAEHWDAVLAHELAHIRRYDYLVNLLQTAAETVLFYHPGVWMVSRWIRIERELCCDDVAADVCGSPIQYAEALTRLETYRHALAGAQPHSAVAAVSGASTVNRVRRLLGVSPKPKHGAARLAGVFAAALVLALVIAFTGASADDEKPAEEKPAAPAAESTETPLPTMDEIAEAWKARQERLRSARIEWEVTTFFPKKSRPPGLNLIHKTKFEDRAKLETLPPADLSLKLKWTVLLDGNMLTRTRDGMFWDMHQGKPRKMVCRATSDGENSKDLFSSDPELPVGFINKKSDNAGLPPLPLNFYFRPCGPRGDGADLKNYRLVAGHERETIDGRECIVVERMPPGPPYEGDIRTFWLDPKRDFIPVRTRYGWKGRNVNISYRSDPIYGWVPSGWHWTYPEEGERKGRIERVTAKVTRCDINVEIPKSEFELEFPVGTYVRDLSKEDYPSWIVQPNGKTPMNSKDKKWRKESFMDAVRIESAKAREAETQLKQGKRP